MKSVAEILTNIEKNLAEIMEDIHTIRCGDGEIPEVEIVEDAKQPEIKLEDVRKVLADKSRSGKTAEVRSLIQKYGSDKLSEIDPKHYPDLLKDAEEL